MRIGKFDITFLELGRFKLDGGAMFGVVPRVLWEKLHPADAKNRIEMVMRCLLIETDNRRILVDNGFGEDRAEKFQKIYDYRSSKDCISVELAKSGVAPDQITDVILTHLHFDHCGGSTIRKDSNSIPSFPSARYYIQQKQLGHARSRMERDRASYFAEDYEPLVDAGLVEVIDGPWELMPGFEIIICNGHTPAMQLVRIQDAGQTVVYGADLIPLASHVSLPWIMAYDLYPVTTLREKHAVLESAAAENWAIIFEHDPIHISGYVRKTDKGFILA